MRSASSMQTPPPTSTSASKRKAQQAQVAKLVRKSAANGGRKIATILPEPKNASSNSPLETSPQQFSNIQFSPEVFGSFAMAGPVTAPAYPQQKLFWDPHQGANAMNIDFGTSDTFADSFALDNSKHVDSFASNNDTMTMSHMASSSYDIDNVMGLSMQSSAAQDMNYLSSAGLITNSSASKLSNTVVDPSLLFSSPNRAPENMNMDISQRANHNEDMRPYAHQIRDAERERETSETRKPKRRRGPHTDSPAVKAALQALRGDEDEEDGPQVKSSKDDVPAKLFRNRGSSNRVTFEEAAHRSSSLQRRRSSHRSSSDRRLSKHTVTLTIGPDGRAKTETKILAEPGSASAMDAESDSGDTESLLSADDTHVASSRFSSFAVPTGNTQAKKLGRSGSKSDAHLQKSLYKSTQSHMIDPALTTTFINEPLGGSGDVESDFEIAQGSGNEKGDAQSELKKMRARSRASGQLHGLVSTSANHHSFDGNAYPASHALTPTQDLMQNISPTTITDPDLATPSTGRDSTISSNTTRCVCHNAESDGELMILW